MDGLKKSSDLHVGLIGATGLVGQAILPLLEAASFVKRITLFSSSRTEGQLIPFRDKMIPLTTISSDDLKECDIIFGMTEGAISAPWFELLLESKWQGLIIDNASTFRLIPTVPLMIPSINRHVYRGQRLIANPNCTTIALLLALAPILRLSSLRRTFAATYQSVSGTGQLGVNTLAYELMNPLDGQAPTSPYVKQIAGNVIPQCDLMKGDWSLEEMKMINESSKILGQSIGLMPTCVRVPVVQSHHIAVSVELKQHIHFETLVQLYNQDPQITFYSQGFPSAQDIVGTHQVHVSRLRFQPDDPLVLHLWIGADNLRVGAATCAFSIAEFIVGLQTTKKGEKVM